jgi:hypothetical protein
VRSGGAAILSKNRAFGFNFLFIKEIIVKKYAVLLALALSLFLVQAAYAELVVNGGFENGDLSGWAYVGDPNQAGADTDAPHSGLYEGYFGNMGSMGVLSQTIATTPGASYSVSFWMWSYGITGDVSNQFQVKWDGSTIFDQTDILGGDLVSYTHYQFTQVAIGSSTLLEFGMRNDPAFIYIDDISVNQVPIPGALWLLLGSD